MRQTIVLAGFAAFGYASPAPQNIDFASVDAAPAPAFTGPPIGATTQDIGVDVASATISAAQAATAVASASATASQASNSLNKRTFCWWWCQPPSKPDPKPEPPKTTEKPKPTAVPTSTSISSASAPTTTAPPGPPIEPCKVQPDGYGPKIQPDTVEAFYAYAPFHDAARSAKAPSGYTSTFVDLNASVSANTYLGLTTFKTYDVAQCGSLCDNKDLCTGFNIFVERDPSIDPAVDKCPNPGSITNYKCTLWGSGVSTESATNTGQFRTGFQVVITASNGYQKLETTTPKPCPGWQPPKKCGNNGGWIHNHPTTCIGTHFYPGPYNPLLCSAYAAAQNAINVKTSIFEKWLSIFMGKYNPLKVSFFNSYMLKKNGKGLGTYCAIYSQGYQTGAATYTPGWQGKDFWSVESSWQWEIDV